MKFLPMKPCIGSASKMAAYFLPLDVSSVPFFLQTNKEYLKNNEIPASAPVGSLSRTFQDPRQWVYAWMLAGTPSST